MAMGNGRDARADKVYITEENLQSSEERRNASSAEKTQTVEDCDLQSLGLELYFLRSLGSGRGERKYPPTPHPSIPEQQQQQQQQTRGPQVVHKLRRRRRNFAKFALRIRPPTP
ncbi:unnamed protein product [Pleuronectes platessa]|uniref:Uncharacterized protein n=1 Tax=Pleuronectes platessa TaxID=8262 RepID=A0A9N7V3E7_PLEPL|nr:unnamed protein product [Pleuronectes platessa]